MAKTHPIIYLISAASGTGKTSLIEKVLERTPGLKISISHTTRPIRSMEQEGINYYFIDETEFQRMKEADEFFESAQIYGNFYGTSRAEVRRLHQQGMDIILEVDWQGMQQVRQKMPDVVSIFVLPPSHQALEQRITARRQDSPEAMKRRLNNAHIEISHCTEYDYLIINDDFEHAVQELQTVILAERYRTKNQMKNHAALLQELMAR